MGAAPNQRASVPVRLLVMLVSLRLAGSIGPGEPTLIGRAQHVHTGAGPSPEYRSRIGAWESLLGDEKFVQNKAIPDTDKG